MYSCLEGLYREYTCHKKALFCISIKRQPFSRNPKLPHSNSHMINTLGLSICIHIMSRHWLGKQNSTCCWRGKAVSPLKVSRRQCSANKASHTHKSLHVAGGYFNREGDIVLISLPGRVASGWWALLSRVQTLTRLDEQSGQISRGTILIDGTAEKDSD